MTPLPAERAEAATERFYGLLPAHVQYRDAAEGYPLKALVAVLASGAAELDAEVDTLLDSLFIETAPEASLSDFAALVAAESLRPLPAGSGHNERAYIARTLHYRRGKGTARVLEELGADVGGFGCVAVEYFMRLARTQHLLDPRPDRPATASLVAGHTASRTGTGFDRLPRLVDVRSIVRAGGRHHVPNVGVHIVRPEVLSFSAPDDALTAETLAGVPVARRWTAASGTGQAGCFQLAAQPGGVLRLFSPGRRAGSGNARTSEATLPDRLRRLPLHLETDALRLNALRPSQPELPVQGWFEGRLPFAIFMRRTNGPFVRVGAAQILIANLENPPSGRPAREKDYRWWENGGTAAVELKAPIECAFDPVTGRVVASAPADPANDVEEVQVAYSYGLGAAMGAGPHDRNGPEVPFDVTDTPSVRHFVRIVDASATESGAPADAKRRVRSLAAALQEWKANGSATRAFIVLVRCDREEVEAPATRFEVVVPGGCELHIVSAQWREPRTGADIAADDQRLGYIVRKGRRFTIDGKLHFLGQTTPELGAGVVTLDGLEITGGITFTGDAFARLILRHCTVRRPTEPALTTTSAMEGAEVVISRSLVGRIRLDYGAALGTGILRVSDSVVAADGAGQGAVSATGIDAELTAVTILGAATFKSLNATNVIFADFCQVARAQSGCVRFSSIAPGSTTPRRFRCQPDLALSAAAERKGSALTASESDSIAAGAAPVFLDVGLAEPTVAMLDSITTDAIAMGGENDCEMGAFAAAAQRLRVHNVESLFDDYVPFGIEAGVIDDTRATSVAQGRNRP